MAFNAAFIELQRRFAIIFKLAVNNLNPAVNDLQYVNEALKSTDKSRCANAAMDNFVTDDYVREGGGEGGSGGWGGGGGNQKIN